MFLYRSDTALSARKLRATARCWHELEADWPVTVLEGGRRVRSEMVLCTAGRVGATDSLNLEACGLTPADRGRLKVDPQTFQTEVPHIYCAGDAIGFPSLASTSMEQGRIAACHAFGVQAPHAPEFFPYGIYSVPEISTVGMSEQELRQRGIAYEAGVARASARPRADTSWA
jgi:NAD(P) transhydrogenase